jgi:hypothetical protein
MVVLEAFFCPKSRETKWSGLGNQAVQFGDHYELVPASALISAFTSGTLPCSAATSSGPFSMPGFALSLAEDSLFGPILS